MTICRYCHKRIFWSSTAFLWIILGTYPATRCPGNDGGHHEPEETS